MLGLGVCHKHDKYIYYHMISVRIVSFGLHEVVEKNEPPDRLIFLNYSFCALVGIGRIHRVQTTESNDRFLSFKAKRL